MAVNETYPGGTTYAKQVTTAVTINTKGSYAQVTAATTSNTSSWGFAMTTADVQRAYLLDVSIGAAGAEVVQLANIPCMNNETSSVLLPSMSLITTTSDIAAGSRIAARVQTSASPSPSVFVWVSIIISATAGRAISSTYGTDTATSKGTSVDPGGSANTKGSYAQITASSAAAHTQLALMATLDRNSGPAFGSWQIDVATGAAGAETVQMADIVMQGDNLIKSNPPMFVLMPVVVPASTRIASRAMCTFTDATDRLLKVGVLGQTAIPSNYVSIGGSFAFC